MEKTTTPPSTINIRKVKKIYIYTEDKKEKQKLIISV